MGWLGTYVGYTKKSKKDLLIETAFEPYGIEDSIVHIEQRGSNVWTIEKNKEGKLFGVLYLTRYNNGEFAYKDISIDMCPYYFDCSKKFYNMCKEIYKNDNSYAKDWLENYEKCQKAEKERKDKIKSLKVGDIVEFITANYGNQKQWKVSSINGAKILFEGYNLRGWKQQAFNIVKGEN